MAKLTTVHHIQNRGAIITSFSHLNTVVRLFITNSDKVFRTTFVSYAIDGRGNFGRTYVAGPCSSVTRHTSKNLHFEFYELSKRKKFTHDF